jgi:nucleoid-associated protein YgaU
MRLSIDRRALTTITVLVSLCLSATVPSFAQNLGDAARQERDRKKGQPGGAHVYTNDDLAKPRILVPEDQARVAREDGSAAPFEVAVPSDSPSPTASASAPTQPLEPVSKDGRETRVRLASSGLSPKSTARIKKFESPSIIASPLGPVPLPAVNLPAQVQDARPTHFPMQVAPPMDIPTSAPVSTATSKPVLARPVVTGAVAKSPVVAERKQSNPVATPAVGESRTIVVQAGDSLWNLATRYLGSAERWTEIAKLNPELTDPSLIHSGQPIRVPVEPPARLKETKDEVARYTKQVVVRPGDTLWSLARTELGRPLAFPCIAHANPQVQSADLIRVGQTLTIPEGCAVSR